MPGIPEKSPLLLKDITDLVKLSPKDNERQFLGTPMSIYKPFIPTSLVYSSTLVPPTCRTPSSGVKVWRPSTNRSTVLWSGRPTTLFVLLKPNTHIFLHSLFSTSLPWRPLVIESTPLPLYVSTSNVVTNKY